MTDEQFMAALEACRLPAAEFNHAAHVRLGYLCLRGHGDAEALARVRSLIQNYANSIGRGSLYDEAITRAFLRLIRECLTTQGDAGGWQAFRDQHPQLLRKDALQRPSRDIFNAS